MNREITPSHWKPHFSLIVLLTLFAVLYTFIAVRAPYQAGGNLFFHTWFTQQIIDTGSIPQESPTYLATTHYSLAPFFHVFSAFGHFVTRLPLIYFFPLMNVVFALLWVLLLYILLLKLFHRRDAVIFALFASLFFTTDTSFLYLLPRSVAMWIFLIGLLVLFTPLSKKIRLPALTFISIALIGFHLPSAPFWIATLLLLTLTQSEYSWRHRIVNAAALFAGAFLYALALIPYIRTHGFPVNPSDQSFQSLNEASTALSQIKEIFSQPLILIITALGIISFITKLRGNNRTAWSLLSIFIASLLIAFQELGGYAFLPERSLSYLFFPFLVLSVYAYLFLAKLIKHQKTFRVTLSLVLLFFFSYGSTQLLAADKAPIKDAIRFEELRSLEKLRREFAHTRFVSDPLTMVKVTTIANMEPAFEFEATNLRAASVREWPLVRNLFGHQEALLPYLEELKTEYVVLSADTFRWFLRSDERFSRSDDFTLIHTSEATTLVDGFPEPLPYFSVHRLKQSSE